MASMFDHILVFCADDRSWPRAMTYADALVASDRRRVTALTRSDDVAAASGIVPRERIVHCRAALPEAIRIHAAWADLVVADAACAALNLETIVVESARPCIVLPSDPPLHAPRHVAIGWNGSTEAARALKASLPLLAGAERIVLLDAEAEPHRCCSTPPRAASFLSEHGLDYLHLRSSGDVDTAGSRLLALAAAHGADLLVMGAWRHQRFSEWDCGTAVSQALHSGTLPILLAH